MKQDYKLSSSPELFISLDAWKEGLVEHMISRSYTSKTRPGPEIYSPRPANILSVKVAYRTRKLERCFVLLQLRLIKDIMGFLMLSFALAHPSNFIVLPSNFTLPYSSSPGELNTLHAQETL
ncbi:UNVERIFIED_CONTAM: hypothetical protein K2H54_065385 [Gekko kuhli]